MTTSSLDPRRKAALSRRRRNTAAAAKTLPDPGLFTQWVVWDDFRGVWRLHTHDAEGTLILQEGPFNTADHAGSRVVMDPRYH